MPPKKKPTAAATATAAKARARATTAAAAAAAAAAARTRAAKKSAPRATAPSKKSAARRTTATAAAPSRRSSTTAAAPSRRSSTTAAAPSRRSSTAATAAVKRSTTTATPSRARVTATRTATQPGRSTSSRRTSTITAAAAVARRGSVKPPAAPNRTSTAAAAAGRPPPPARRASRAVTGRTSRTATRAARGRRARATANATTSSTPSRSPSTSTHSTDDEVEERGVTTTSASGAGADDRAEDTHRRRSLGHTTSSASPRAAVGGEAEDVIIIDSEGDGDEESAAGGRTASASRTAPDAAAEEDGEDGEDTVLFRSDADMAEVHTTDARVRHRGTSPAMTTASLLPTLTVPTSPPGPRTPPRPRTLAAAAPTQHHDEDEDSSSSKDGLRGRRAECSPEALTADSESKRSSHRWQRQLLAGSTPSTQRLRDEDAAESTSKRGGGGGGDASGSSAHLRGVDRSALAPHASRAAGHATPEAVKQLFSQRPRSISLASLSDLADSPEDTMIMATASDDDGGETDVSGPPRLPRRAHVPRPLDVSSIASASASRSRRSESSIADLATSRPPPGSASAQTPPPTASLSLGAASALPQLRSSTDLLLQRQPTHLSATQSSDRAGYGDGGSSVTDALPSPPPKTAAQTNAGPAAVSPNAPAAGHLRMRGSSRSRQGSPAAPPSASSAPTWRAKAGAAADVAGTPPRASPATTMTSTTTTAHGTVTTPPLVTSPPSTTAFPAHPPTHVYLHARFSASPAHGSGTSSPLSRLADHEVRRMEADAALGPTPPRLWRLRDPPVWRSPQPAQLPTSLSVSPASLHNTGGGRALAAPRPPSPAPPSTQATAAASTSGPAPSRAVPRARQGDGSLARATSAATQPLASTAAAAAAGGRPSTQLITKAAATRPVASPGTMWICLDEDDSESVEAGVDESEAEADATRAANHRGDGWAGVRRHTSRVRVKQEGEAEEGTRQTPVWPPNAVAADRTTAAERERAETRASARPRRSRSRSRSRSSPSRGSAAAGVHDSGDTAAGPLRRRPPPPPEKSHPIAEILSPTFRPRRRLPDTPSGPVLGAAVLSPGGGPVAARARPTAAPVIAAGRPARPLRDGSVRLPTSPQHYICLDDDDDDAEEAEGDEDELLTDGGFDTTHEAEAEEEWAGVPPRTRTRVSSPEAHRRGHDDGGGAVTPPVSLPPLIIDDDDDDDEEEGEVREKAKAAAAAAAAAAHHSTAVDVRPSPRNVRAPPSPPPQSVLPAESRAHHDDEGTKEEEEGGHDGSALRSPLKPNVRDFIFPNRLDPELRPASALYESIHAYQRHYQQQHPHRHAPADPDAEERAMRSTAKAPATTTAAAAAAAKGAVPQHAKKRPRGAGAVSASASVVPSLPDWGRPADTLLRDFFPAKFTKRSFMDAAHRVLSPMHFLDDGDFWAAFASAEFVGEGSFGLVWRCRTVDGDLVAVKSCPILLRTKANIEDSFSTIREIATMRFLNEMQVPYVLPLHSAFFVHGREALPPTAQAALDWRRQLRREAEAMAAQEAEVLKVGRSGATAASAHAARAAAVAASSAAKDAPLTFEQHVALQLERIAAAEGPDARATRAAMQAVRLPRFLSITEDDLTQSDATAFLVMELCDGDAEGIPRSDRVAKGVAYCVSSALAAMHELGLLHLDLKPSNVLFAYEHGPSQQTAVTAAAASGSGAPATDAVKFYLSDFGNCRLVGPDAMAEVADAYGTFEYMDHRALRDAVCGRPTDAFSLGATLYELLFGRRLYPKCTNPRCTAEEDHTRDCFVAAASKPVKLLTSTGAVLGPVAPASAGRGRGRGGRSAAKESAAAPLSPLQFLTLELLQHTWAARMTAEECRRYLVETFHIMQAD